ncbi:MAG: transporter substrate-binding domain-containing protein [Deltaproteobacteria bacterium]|nr:transporter substrate-binding domain-containing protein [Deltaproteobacteria bacterium]
MLDRLPGLTRQPAPPAGRRLLCCLLAVLVGLTGFLAAPAEAVDKGRPSRELVARVNQPAQGDLDAMVQRRHLRFLVTFNKTNYFLDGPVQRGVTYEYAKNFVDFLNKRLQTKHLKVFLVMVPVTRDQLLPMLTEGKGDIAAASLSITPERLKTVDFSTPIYDQAKEVVVTAPGAPELGSLADLSGKRVYVRKSSSYFESLGKLNQKLAQEGKAPVIIEPADEHLETEDILEMVNVGLVNYTVADDFLADLWSKVFTSLRVRGDLVLASQVKIAWAIRQHSPQLKKALDKFIVKYRKGSTLGNILVKRYYENNKFVENSLTVERMDRFKETVQFFKQYAGQYNMDWLLLTALAYQESGLDQSKKSPVGAVGVMQLLPRTAAGHPVYIKRIDLLENNVHAGVKYLRHIYDQNFRDIAGMTDVDKILLTFASYNAGPAKVASLRAVTQKMGLNPKVWFNNVEVAAARKIGRETVQYVGNIYKYYVAYRRALDLERQKTAVKDKLGNGK